MSVAHDESPHEPSQHGVDPDFAKAVHPGGQTGQSKRILFVTADVAEMVTVRLWAASSSTQCEIVSVETSEAALELLAKSRFDVVLSEFGGKKSAGLEFLNVIWERYPKTVRFVVANEADHNLITDCVLGSHQFLAKPLKAEALQSALARVFLVDELIGSKQIKELISRVRSFPSIPSLYFEVVRELKSPSASPQSIGERIGKDLAMTTKMIQMVNSAYFGLERQITDPSEAVSVLGTETVRSLVLGIHAFAQADKVKPLYFSADRIWRHSLAVAETAKRIALRATGDEQTADDAYTAGLLHDVGKLILAGNFDAQYCNALELARKQKLLPAEVERGIFEVSHAEAGAYMLSLWGLPLPIIEATALHHTPSRSHSQNFSPLTAVHVANVLEHEANPGQDGFVDPEIDHAYLVSLKVDQHLEEWRTLVRATKPEPKAKPSASAPTPAPKASVRVASPPAPAAAPKLSLSAAVIAAIAGWMSAIKNIFVKPASRRSTVAPRTIPLQPSLASVTPRVVEKSDTAPVVAPKAAAESTQTKVIRPQISEWANGNPDSNNRSSADGA